MGGCATCPLPEPAQTQIRIADGKSGQTIPGRINFTDDKGFFILHAEEGQSLARPGVVYTGHESSSGLAPGSYRFMPAVVLVKMSSLVVDERFSEDRMRPEREGHPWMDCSRYPYPHKNLHGHGDATPEETMLSIAGEGIELAVATDHNHHTDYRPSMKLKVQNTSPS